jgi:hypothetical protein
MTLMTQLTCHKVFLPKADLFLVGPPFYEYSASSCSSVYCVLLHCSFIWGLKVNGGVDALPFKAF